MTSPRSVLSGSVEEIGSYESKGTYKPKNQCLVPMKEWFVTLPFSSFPSDCSPTSYNYPVHSKRIIKNDLRGKDRKSRRFSKGSKYIKDLRNLYTTGSYTPHNRTRLQIGHTEMNNSAENFKHKEAV